MVPSALYITGRAKREPSSSYSSLVRPMDVVYAPLASWTWEFWHHGAGVRSRYRVAASAATVSADSGGDWSSAGLMVAQRPRPAAGRSGSAKAAWHEEQWPWCLQA